MPIRHPPLSFVSTVPLNGGAPVETVQQAISFIDRNVPRELAALPRWTFARALLVEPPDDSSIRHSAMSGGSISTSA